MDGGHGERIQGGDVERFTLDLRRLERKRGHSVSEKCGEMGH